MLRVNVKKINVQTATRSLYDLVALFYMAILTSPISYISVHNMCF